MQASVVQEGPQPGEAIGWLHLLSCTQELTAGDRRPSDGSVPSVLIDELLDGRDQSQPLAKNLKSRPCSGYPTRVPVHSVKPWTKVEIRLKVSDRCFAWRVWCVQASSHSLTRSSSASGVCSTFERLKLHPVCLPQARPGNKPARS